MGQPKLLLPWRGGTVVEHVLAQWRASQVSRVVIVVHPDDRVLAELCRDSGAQVVVPEVPPVDMKASVGHALRWISEHEAPQPEDAWLVAPADMPRLSTSLIDTVIAEHRGHEFSILQPVCAGRKGHPVLFPWSLAAMVEELKADEGLDAIVRHNPVREIPWTDSRAFEDLDLPADYDRLQRDDHA
jgi:molybdenum cofactor cytidylyltransferase